MPRLKKNDAFKNTLRLYSKTWSLAEKLGKGDKTAGFDSLMAHAEEFINQDICPVCKRPFSDCEYFQRLENE